MNDATLTRIAQEMAPSLTRGIDVSPEGRAKRLQRIEAATIARRVREGLLRDSRTMMRSAQLQSDDELYDALSAVLASLTNKDSPHAESLQALLLRMDDERGSLLEPELRGHDKRGEYDGWTQRSVR